MKVTASTKKNPVLSEEQKEYRRENYRQNREVYIARAKKWKQENPDKVYNPEINRKQKFRSKYGLQWEDFERMYQKQNGQCLVCKKYSDLWPEKKTEGLYVDHNHSSGKVRGLLCHYCNLGLGHFKDNANLLIEAARYLNESD